MRSGPLSVRTRRIEAGSRDAIETRYDPYEPLEMACSDLGEDYLAGRIKVVSNWFRADGRTLHMSYSVIWTVDQDRSFYASLHREAARLGLREAYKNAVARAVPHNNAKTLKRRRHRLNQHFGSIPPELDQVDHYFKDHPDAIAAAAHLRALWARLRLG